MATDVEQKVNSILDSIKKKSSVREDTPIAEEDTPLAEEDTHLAEAQKNAFSPNKASVNNKADEIRGKPKSGRFWKSKKEKFSKIVKTKGIRPDFQAKTALRIELKRTKDISHQLLEQIKEKEVSRKERRRENLKRAEENKRKSEIVQVITNTKKLKRMKKKQLRFIEKRDITNVNKTSK